jgi:hypothetical protein
LVASDATKVSGTGSLLILNFLFFPIQYTLMVFVMLCTTVHILLCSSKQ